jgi:ABC-type protease/lipase transport system fused ATPase/permease subunit
MWLFLLVFFKVAVPVGFLQSGCSCWFSSKWLFLLVFFKETVQRKPTGTATLKKTNRNSHFEENQQEQPL